MGRILNFGSLNIDYVYKVEHFVSAGETLSSDSLDVNCGGKGLNQSIAAAKAGATVYHAGAIGSDGSVYYDGEKKLRQGIYKVKAVDTTAAGDTMMGYFAAGLAAGKDPAEALDTAAKASSITVSRHGAAKSIPTYDELF